MNLKIWYFLQIIWMTISLLVLISFATAGFDETIVGHFIPPSQTPLLMVLLAGIGLIVMWSDRK